MCRHIACECNGYSLGPYRSAAERKRANYVDKREKRTSHTYTEITKVRAG